jgi:hypothetical protein
MTPALPQHAILIAAQPAAYEVLAGMLGELFEPDLYKFAVEQNLEGIVSKRADSAYKAGRSPRWVKVKTPAGIAREQDRFEHLRR